MLAIKPQLSALPPTLLRPAAEAQKADEMCETLRTMRAAIERDKDDPALLIVYAEYIEAMSFYNPRRWFVPPAGLAWASEDLFDICDQLMACCEGQRGEHKLADSSARLLTCSMTTIISHVVSFLSLPEADDIQAAVVRTATGASQRFRSWCAPDEPNRHQMFGVLAYAVVGAASRATERLLSDPDCDDLDEIVPAIVHGLAEALATLEQLRHECPAELWFDSGLGSHWAGEASRGVRALQGIAWSYDMLGQLGLPLDKRVMNAQLDAIEMLWPHTIDDARELTAVLGALAHGVSAWSTAIEQKTVDSVQMPNRALWLARQAAGIHGGNLQIAHKLLDVAQALVATSGAALEQGVVSDARLATRSAKMVRTAVERGGGMILPQALLGTVDNLARVTASAWRASAPDFEDLLNELSALTSGAVRPAIGDS